MTGVTPRQRRTKTGNPTTSTQPPTAPSKQMGGFKKRSRNKLIKAINDLTAQPELLVTLTYTDSVSEQPETWKRHLDNLRREMSRKHPQCWWVWRIEPQEQTGKPHFHLVGSLGDQTTCEDFWNWLHPTWCRVVGVDPKNAQFATTVKAISKDMEKLSRYMSKEESSGSYHGFREAWMKLTNRWGILGRNHAPLAPVIDYEVGPETLAGAKELVLGSIDSQMNALRDKLASSSPTTSFKDINKMKKSLSDKQELKNKITHLQDWFGILDADHVEAIKEYLEDRKAAGLL
ncbi:hypothetical protein [Desulfovibrio sp. Huiquan2017]|uniref:rolling circle replication-associated protein n=1 Tax=Desulfovibrio sp. Huiquan2017 TaxID=2816861 RepID=UPI001A9353E0|nr:hypothetical protein [Desulfovibrio sp. Huiquan2017]